jgi:D-alanyl-D-alanine carboxypeptidase
LACIALCRLAFILAFLAAPLGARAAPYAAVVMDARTGEVLHAVNADARLHPASLTKMMTLYIAFEAIRRGEISLDSQVLISAHAASEPPSKLGLRAGQRVQLRYLIRAAAVKSANDAATAIAEAIEGSEEAFARRMNRTARALGMTNSQFRNAHGLTEAGHFSSARDMTILGRHLLYDYPDFYHIFSRRTADAGVAQVANTNSRFLDAYPGADGIKTGYTSAAGFNLTASAERGSKRIIATIFGGTSTAQRNARMVELMDLGFARAPERVQVARPALPRYDRLPPEPAEPPQVAAAAGAAEGSGRVAAGRILRVSGAVTRSPRPRPRPAAPSAEPTPEALIAAIEGSVSAAIAEVAVAAAAPPSEAAPPPETPAPAAAAEPPRPRPKGQVAPELAALPGPDPAEAEADADAGTVAVAADDPAAGPVGIAAAAGADAEARLAGVAPPPRPERPAEAGAPEAGAGGALVVAEAAPSPEAGPPAPPPQTAPAGTPDDPGIDLAAAAAPAAGAQVAPAGAVGVGEAPAAAAGADPAVTLAALPPPEVTDPVLRPEPEAPEVVARMSSSGGRHWGVAIGQYRARAEAERALITLALADMTGLDGALRRVNQRAGVWEASFMGLSEEQAARACRRMEARGMACRTLGP